MGYQIQLYDLEPDTGNTYQKVISGLQKPNKEISDTLLYDEHGSQLYAKLCLTQDYYATRTELSIMQEYIDEIVSIIGEQALLIEYGSGNSVKTRLLLDHLPNLSGYIPIDISKEFLMDAATEVAKQYPHIEVLPICADYDYPIKLPNPTESVARRVAYYPGTTIGNLHPHEAIAFLERVRDACGPNNGLLVGVDLKKDIAILSRAYNDSDGLNAAFTLNTLAHLNWRFDANFILDTFEYESYYNPEMSRIECYLVCHQDQTVHLNGTSISLRAGEKIQNGYSYKYSLDEFAALAAKSGWEVKHVWTDDYPLFSLQYLTSR